MKTVVLVFFLMFTVLNAFAQNANQGAGVIRELSGTVELKADGASSFVKAKSGDQVSENTVISTGFKSYALVGVGSAVITVRPLTRLTLTEIRSTSADGRSQESLPGNLTLAEGRERIETINVNLQAGRVRVDVNPPAGTRASMSVTSPIATASVRGTGFEMDIMNVSVDKGAVEFSGKRGSKKQVKAGDLSRVEGDGKAANPVETKAAGLIPKTPVGTDRSGGSMRESPANTSGLITINLNYGDRES